MPTDPQHVCPSPHAALAADERPRGVVPVDAQSHAETDTPREHIPVMLHEAVAGLALVPGAAIVDGTFGRGGHARLIAAQIGSGGRLLCIDRDPDAAAAFDALSAAHPETRLAFVNASYADLLQYLARIGVEPGQVDGVLLDLGFSSPQIDDPQRGFAFSHEGPLDMRYDRTRGLSAADVVNTWEAADIARMLWTLGDERQSRQIAAAIVRERQRQPIETTTALANLVERALGGRRGSRTHPATRTFQALRMGVNDELGHVERGINAALAALRPGGRLSVITFHSGEDRLVKQLLREAATACRCPRGVPVCVCGGVAQVAAVGKAQRPSDAEVAANPRARSATLRVVERLDTPLQRLPALAPTWMAGAA